MKDSIIIDNKEFRQVSINENYFVSSNGEVFSKHSNRIISGSICRARGKLYRRIDINVGGKQKHFPIHRLVFEAWVRPLTDGEQVNHIDDDSLNNDYRNLYAGDQRENIADCFENKHRVGNIYTLTVHDLERDTVETFCPARGFINYSGHSCNSGSIKKMLNKNWMKKRYEILEFRKVDSLEEFIGVTTMGDECNPVGLSLSQSEAHCTQLSEEIV